jgi:peptidoglycan hydrolase CwlO-like protein
MMSHVRRAVNYGRNADDDSVGYMVNELQRAFEEVRKEMASLQGEIEQLRRKIR